MRRKPGFEPKFKPMAANGRVALDLHVSLSTHTTITLEALRSGKSMGEVVESWAARFSVSKGAAKLGHYPK